MISSIRATIRAFAAPEHLISCAPGLWRNCLQELARRGRGRCESGAFLLGAEAVSGGRPRRRVTRYVCYDDLDPHALDSGIIDFDGSGYPPLWAICHAERLKVVADVHTHPGVAAQSGIDKLNPMIAARGHIAFIVPHFASTVPPHSALGIYEYLGSHEWLDHTGVHADRCFYTGFWA
jgi:hypothetical protein